MKMGKCGRIDRLVGLILLLCVICSAGAQAEAVLPQSLKNVEESAFQGNSSIRKIELANGVETIGSKAFAGSGLNEINFPDSLTSVADDAFESCGHIEAHASGAAGKTLIARLAKSGYDIVWADEVLGAAQSYNLRAAEGQTIKREFAAPQTGRYTFEADGSSAVFVIRYDQFGNQISEKKGSLSFNMQEGASAFLGFRFESGTAAGSFMLNISRTENPMAALVYTPSLWICRDDQPIRNAQMDGSLAQLDVGEVLTPTLEIKNSQNYKLSGQVLAKLDGKSIDLGFFAVGAKESCMIHVPAEMAFMVETAGKHSIEYAVKLNETENVASMVWEITDERPAQTEIPTVRTGKNTVEISKASGNLFKFTPSQSGVYKFYTSASNCDTFASLRDGANGAVLTSDDDSGSPYQNFVFSYELKANKPVYIELGMKNYKGPMDLALNITNCGTTNLRYSTSLYVFNGYSWVDADNGMLTGTGMVKLKGKGDLSTLESDEYLTPVLVITNAASKAMPLGLTAVIDGETILWSGDCQVGANGKFVAYLYSTAGRMFEKPGMHTVDYYVNGKLAVSYTWEVTGNRTPRIYSGTPMLQLGENYRTLDDTEGSFDWFKAPYPGVYRFYSIWDTWDPCGFLFDEDMNLLAYNDDYGDGEGFVIYQYLEEGQIVYLQSMFFEEMRDTSRIGVDFVSTEPTPARKLSIGTTPMGMAVNDIFTASFTAPYTGEFRFRADGNGSTVGITASLYDTSWQKLDISSTGYFSYFNLLCSLEEGETVYLKATCTRADPSVELTVSGTPK